MDLTLTITPVIDMTNWPEERAKVAGLQEETPWYMLGGNVELNGNATVNLDGAMLTELQTLNARVNDVIVTVSTQQAYTREQIARLGIRIDNVSRTVGNMKMILDTGVLVGAITPLIDRNLYNRGVTYDRTGTSTNHLPVYTKE